MESGVQLDTHFLTPTIGKDHVLPQHFEFNESTTHPQLSGLKRNLV